MSKFIPKYKQNEEKRTANAKIKDNNDQFGSGLFDLHKAKHQKTLEQLLAINKPMFGKEE